MKPTFAPKPAPSATECRPAPLSDVRHATRERLRAAGLKPTRPRLILADLLFSGGPRHVDAETLHREALARRQVISIATVYNTLNSFVEHGLIRALAVASHRMMFDTSTHDHHHFHVDGEKAVFDIPPEMMPSIGAPVAPPGYEVMAMDVVVHLRRVPELQNV